MVEKLFRDLQWESDEVMTNSYLRPITLVKALCFLFWRITHVRQIKNDENDDSALFNFPMRPKVVTNKSYLIGSWQLAIPCTCTFVGIRR